MNRFPIVVVGCASLIATAVMAQQYPTPEQINDPIWVEVHAKAIADLNKAVATCTAKVRDEVAASKFDAYVDARAYAQIHTFGNQEELFHFDKCMTEVGAPVDP